MAGTTFYVADAHAILEVPGMCRDSKALNNTLDRLTDLVKKPCLTFPDLVREDCKRLEGETIYTWIKAVAGHRKDFRIPSHYQERALSLCEGIADPDDEHEQTQVMVAAMAFMLQEANHSAVVVTEDRRPQPTRLCLAEACVQLGLATVTTRELLEFAGAAAFLR